MWPIHKVNCMKIKLSFFVTFTWWIRKKSCQRKDELCSFTCHCNIFFVLCKTYMETKTREALHSLCPYYRHTTFFFLCSASPSGENSQGFSSKSVLWVALWPSSATCVHTVHHSAQSSTALGHKLVFLGTVCTILPIFTVFRVSLEYIWRINFINLYMNAKMWIILFVVAVFVTCKPLYLYSLKNYEKQNKQKQLEKVVWNVR